MPLKTLTAATLLALSSIAFAQTTSTDAQTSTDTPTGTSASGASVGGVDLTNKCVGMMGAEREKCLLDQRSGAATGATTATPGIATTAPAPLATPSSPTNPTTLPGSSTTPSGM
jgi:hypothetical protein